MADSYVRRSSQQDSYEVARDDGPRHSVLTTRSSYQHMTSMRSMKHLNPLPRRTTKMTIRRKVPSSPRVLPTSTKTRTVKMENKEEQRLIRHGTKYRPQIWNGSLLSQLKHRRSSQTYSRERTRRRQIRPETSPASWSPKSRRKRSHGWVYSNMTKIQRRSGIRIESKLKLTST